MRSTLLTTLRYRGLSLRYWLDDHTVPLTILSLLLIVAGGAQLTRALTSAPTTAPIILVATPTLAPLPVASRSTGLPRAATAYDEPDGRVLGALDEGRGYTVLARFGSEWLQLDAGSGPVWVRAREAGLSVNAALADLTPPAVPAVVYVERPAPAPSVVYVQPAPAPESAPASVDLQVLNQQQIAPPLPGQAPASECVTAPDGGGTTCSGTW